MTFLIGTIIMALCFIGVCLCVLLQSILEEMMGELTYYQGECEVLASRAFKAEAALESMRGCQWCGHPGDSEEPLAEYDKHAGYWHPGCMGEYIRSQHEDALTQPAIQAEIEWPVTTAQTPEGGEL